MRERVSRVERGLLPPYFARYPLPALALVAFAVLLSQCVNAPGALAAGSVAAGRQKAVACRVCHGLDGLSRIPDAPNIAGNPAPYLARQLNAFRKGERKNEMMSVVGKELSDQDVDDLAAYYAAIEVTAKVPQ